MKYYTFMTLAVLAGCSADPEDKNLAFVSDKEKHQVGGRVFKTANSILEVIEHGPTEVEDKTAYLVKIKATNLEQHKKRFVPAWAADLGAIGPGSVVSQIVDEYENQSLAVSSSPAAGEVLPGESVVLELHFTPVVSTATKLSMILTANSWTGGQDLVFQLER